MLFLASILLTDHQCCGNGERRGGPVWMEEEVGRWRLLLVGYVATGWFFIIGSSSSDFTPIQVVPAVFSNSLRSSVFLTGP